MRLSDARGNVAEIQLPAGERAPSRQAVVKWWESGHASASRTKIRRIGMSARRAAPAQSALCDQGTGEAKRTGREK
jgi:hypothetical protein